MKKKIICSLMGILFAMLLLYSSNCNASIPDNYFKGACITTSINCFNVDSNSDNILSYDKVNLKRNDDWLTAEWLDVDGIGSNKVNLNATCKDLSGNNYEVKVVHTYNGSSIVDVPYILFANTNSIGVHKYKISAVIKGKTLYKTVIINVVQTTQGTSSIRYKTSGIVVKKLVDLVDNSYITSFTSQEILDVRDLKLTSEAESVLGDLIPNTVRNGEECLVEGAGIIEVYNVNTKKVLGTYRLDTQYNSLLSDFAWSTGAKNDFQSKKVFTVPYRLKNITTFIVKFVDDNTKKIITETLSGDISFYNDTVTTYELDSMDPNPEGYFIINGLRYLYKNTQISLNVDNSYSHTNDLTYLTISNSGVYDEFYNVLMGNKDIIRITVYYLFVPPTPIPSPSPNPTSSPTTGPTTGPTLSTTSFPTLIPTQSSSQSPSLSPTPIFQSRVIKRCISKQDGMVFNSIDLGTQSCTQIFSSSASYESGYIHDSMESETKSVNIFAPVTYYLDFYYYKIGSLNIMHRDKFTNELLDISVIPYIPIYSNTSFLTKAKSPGEIEGYVHESLDNWQLNDEYNVIISNTNPTQIVTFYYVKAHCTLRYVAICGSKSTLLNSYEIDLPIDLTIPGRVNENAVSDSQGMFDYTGNNFTEGNTSSTININERNHNATITIYYKADIVVNSIDVTGAWNHWKNNSHRFLCLEKITVNCNAKNVEKMVVRLSPELEAMKYTTKSGITYDYEDFFKKKVIFPQDSTVYFTDNKASWKYSLPLANSTLSKKDIRIKSSYWIKVTLYSGDYSETFTINDIEITGKVTDLISN